MEPFDNWNLDIELSSSKLKPHLTVAWNYNFSKLHKISTSKFLWLAFVEFPLFVQLRFFAVYIFFLQNKISNIDEWSRRIYMQLHLGRWDFPEFVTNQLQLCCAALSFLQLNCWLTIRYWYISIEKDKS